jgi:NADPH-dependent 2,4-dienoyl-CoA reductase/sulfur reductase-like enzyme
MPSNEGPNILQAIPRVLVIGGSYAGLAATVNLIDLCDGKQARFASASTEEEPLKVKLPLDITIVDERDGYCRYYSILTQLTILTSILDHLIGNPLAFASDDASSKSWTKFQDIPALKLPNIHFLQGSVATINCETKTASIVDTVTKQIRQEKYDYLLVASGLRRTSPVVPQALNRDQFIAEAKTHTKAIRDAKEGVVVIGGGKCFLYTIEFTLMFSPRGRRYRDG